MTDWAGFWLGLGLFLGFACIGQGLVCIARAMYMTRHAKT
jgi:hypothetical protein